jgi:bifunctional DNA-binding transcriptional regulator/antitoxin component of YhaV-PrlF toxin-antitoxin module
MVTWKRKLIVTGPNNQAQITLPKIWVDSLDLEPGQELEVEEMKREEALKIRPSENKNE